MTADAKQRACLGVMLVAMTTMIGNAGGVSAAELWQTRSLPSNDGYTWTLTSRIGNMLKEAEAMFGERDKEWTILGVEVCMDQGATPQNWYPGSPERKDIIFQITPAEDLQHACYQLAHEVLHSLSPHVGKTATVLEEGVATWFARWYVKKSFGLEIGAELESYCNAYQSVDTLLKQDRQAVLKLRKVEPNFDKMTVATFRAAGVVATDDVVRDLLKIFKR